MKKRRVVCAILSDIFPISSLGILISSLGILKTSDEILKTSDEIGGKAQSLKWMSRKCQNGEGKSVCGFPRMKKNLAIFAVWY